MTPETAIALLGLITLVTIATEIMFTYATLGFGYGFSSNRPATEKSAAGVRVERVYRNQVESIAYTVPALAAVALLGLEGAGASLAALLIVLGRAGFVLMYYTGLPFARVPFFGLATVSSLYLIYLALTPAPV